MTQREMTMWEDRMDELPRKESWTCANCAHDGQCVGLPFCGGRYWKHEEEEERGEE